MTKDLRLNDRTIDRIKPPESGQVDYVDPGMPEFGLRVSQGGTKTWWVRVKLGKQRLRLKVGRWPVYTRDEAWEIARGWIKLADQGIDPRRKAKPGITLGDLFDKYIARQREKGLRYWKTERSVFEDKCATWKQREARSIERAEVREWFDAIRAYAPVGAEECRGILGRIYRFGIGQDLVTVDPTAGIERVTARRVRTKTLTDEEIRQLWALLDAGNTIGYRAMQLMLLCGTRHVETLRIKRSNITEQWLRIEGQYTKNGFEHVAPITKAVRTVLDHALELGESDWLFPSPRFQTRPIVDIVRDAQAARTATGIDFTPHDLRRTAYTGMRRLGIRDEVIGAFFNHQPKGLRRNYDHWGYAPERQEAAEVWHAELERILRKGELGRVVPIHRQS